MSEYTYYTDQPDMVWRYRDGEDQGWVRSVYSEWIPAFTPRDLWLTEEGCEYPEDKLPEWVNR